jgi:hypothetical protein
MAKVLPRGHITTLRSLHWKNKYTWRRPWYSSRLRNYPVGLYLLVLSVTLGISHPSLHMLSHITWSKLPSSSSGNQWAWRHSWVIGHNVVLESLTYCKNWTVVFIRRCQRSYARLGPSIQDTPLSDYLCRIKSMPVAEVRHASLELKESSVEVTKDGPLHDAKLYDH